jgi:hypothetical protein
MNEDELRASYIHPLRVERRRQKRAIWIMVALPVILFGLGGAWCARESSMPAWIPVIAFVLGLIVGMWMSLSRFGFRGFQSRGYRILFSFVAYLCWRGFTDFLAWRVIPQSHFHFLFDMAFLVFFLTGLLAAIYSYFLRDYLGEEA